MQKQKTQHFFIGLDEETKQDLIGLGIQQRKPFETAIAVADYYGFKPTTSIHDKKCTSWKECVVPHERYLQQDLYLENKKSNSDYSMFYNIKIDKSDNKEFCLSVFNTKKSIAEAIIMQTSMSILNEYGHEDIFVDINSIGDMRSFTAFNKDLSFYYKKNINSLCSHCKNKVQKNMTGAVDCKNEKCLFLKEDAPKSISYLNDDQIRHFKEVLEYFESINVPYKINNNLISYDTDEGLPNIIFQIKDAGHTYDENNVLAKGERYEHQLKNIKAIYAQNVGKKRIPSVYTSINLSGNKKTLRPVSRDAGNVSYKNPQKDGKIYFVHIGHEARLQSLNLIENLRRKNIHILQSIIEDGLIKQMSEAENINASYTIIMGVKEVREKYVIVRNMETHSQESISIENLPIYLKHVVK